ncbi:CapA family protein [Anaeromicropila herbilytica]|uniref:Capsular polysaccharide biosynthesis protein n=1 Tax=Anaeromicropila herbilytica TaxID=2785025 RepID=A0A7R7EKL7_9FIRM|nr:CapA family protein [Anaeromicropila herbilytica]BCN30540.1 capsular polysaccharide biosynthesis protein [Anaeromicropila herbilytica]
MKKKIIFLALLNSSLIVVIIVLLIFIQSNETKNTAFESRSQAVFSNETEKNGQIQEDSTSDLNINENREDIKKEKDNNSFNKNTTDVVNQKKDIGKATIEDTKSKANDINLVFTGDIFLSDYVLSQYNKSGIEGILSKQLLSKLKNADIAMANEEFSFSNRGVKMKNKQFTFRVAPHYVKIFQDMGIDIVTLANNHSLDYGTEALLDSINTLDAASIRHVGAGANISKAKEYQQYNIHGKKIAIIGASRVIPVAKWNATYTSPGLLTTYDPTTLLSVIQEAKRSNDIVIVYVHWGIERKTSPEDYQRRLAKQYIDAGADVIIGSHPHVLQGIEYYKNKPIIYSLGNFIFYSSIQKTALLEMNIDQDNDIVVSIVPCFAENAKTKELELKKMREDFYKYITNLSYHITIDENGHIVRNK